MILGLSLLLLLIVAAHGQTPCANSFTGLKVSFTQIDSAVEWSPRFAGAAGEGNVVMVASQKRKLWRSVDDGVSFKQVNLPGPSANATVEASGVHFSADAAKRFYAYGRVDGADAYWTTSDAGATFKLKQPNAEKILWINPHPILADVALGLAADGYSSEFAQSTYLTTDFGQTWARIGGNTTFQTMFGCESAACPLKTAILFQEAPRGAVWDDCRSGTCHVSRVTFDPHKSSATALGDATQLGDSINGFGETHWPWYDQFAKSVIYTSSSVCEKPDNVCVGDDFKQRVRFSTDGGVTWKTARFPFETQHTMRFVSTERDVLLVGIRHQDKEHEANYGDLYVSSIAADSPEVGYFTRSLKHVVMTGKQWWENNMFAGSLAVERQGELDGVMIANRYRSRADGSADLDCLQSVLTFDMGATWSLIPAPAGSCDASSSQCSLHLLMFNEYPGVYSPTDAVGLWISDGMVGECLNMHASTYGTYYSNDGGATFTTMSKDPLIYEVSNHGALVVGALVKAMSNQFTYTTNMGNSFQTCQFNSTPMLVENILTRSFDARSFVMHGRLTTDADSPGFLAYFGFDDVHDRDCDASDLELWSPGKKCLLGEHVVWSRRRPDAQCHNPTEFEAKAMESPCQCTEADYECDFCFEASSNGSCQAQPTNACQQFARSPESLLCGGAATEFVATDGYRLQPNNRCKGGVQHGQKQPCPEKNGGIPVAGNDPTLAIGIASGCVVLAIVLAGIAFIYFKRRQKLQYMSMADE
jgi:hypothetical protein